VTSPAVWLDRQSSMVRGSMIAVAVFLASRFAVLVAIFVIHTFDGSKQLMSILTNWDGAWYLRVAEHGYPTSVPEGVGNAAQSTLPFFPGYPLLVKGVAVIPGLSLEHAAVLAALASGTAAAILVWHLAARYYDEATATRTVALLSFFPSAYVLSMTYAEGLFIALAAGCLLALRSERWVVAGLCAAWAGATRLPGVALALACVWVAAMAVRQRGDRKALVAAVIAPLGTVSWLAYLRVHTGSWSAFTDAQRRGWANEGVTGLARQLEAIFSGDLFRNLSVWQGGVGLAILVVATVVFLRQRPDPVLIVYVAGAVVPTAAAGLFAPRYIMVAIPLLMAIASRVKGGAFDALIGVSAVVMTMLFVTVSITSATVP